MVVGRDSERRRRYTDAEVIALREAYAASSMAPSTFAKQWPGRRTDWKPVYEILDNRTYQWLLPGHPYRMEYDRNRA